MPESIDLTSTTDSAAIASLLDELPPEAPDVQPGDQPPTPKPPAGEEAVVTPDPKPESPEFPDDEKELDDYLDKNFKPQTQNQAKAIPVLKGKIKELNAKLKEERERAETFSKEKDSIKPLTPELQSELEELRKLRKAEAPDKDPEIQAKYIAPLSQKEDQALGILVRGGLSEGVVELIKGVGGLMKASNSEEPVPRALSRDGESWSEWIENTLLPKTPLGDRKRIESLLTDMLNLNDQMTEEVSSEKFNSEERTQEKFKRMGEEFNAGVREVASSMGNLVEKWEVKGTDAEKAAAELHNTRLDKVIASMQDFQKNLNSPAYLGKMAATAGQAAYLSEVNAELMDKLDKAQAEIAAQEKRIAKIKGSSSSARSSNVAAAPAPQGVPKLASTKQALDSYLSDLG